ncbi:hypothetical protein VNO78_20080 [Psophocarpus tetragonolobus]|uniref:C2 domain-containing protein n=1 Tax=Psophocarpus tetragonolobus TaxID=3891 RepID=A0AAN9SDU4_PSOTE
MSEIMAPFQLLELNVISAQDLAHVARNMRTYAVTWVHPDRKLSTRVDTEGNTQPTWNDKFVFRVDEDFLYSDTSAIMIEIYALHWFKDIHVGTVRVLIGNLVPPPSKPYHNNNRTPLGMRFLALQVRRPSGRPQGILNIGFTLLDSSMRSMPLYTHNASALDYRHLMGEKDAYHTPKPDLRRTKSDSSSMLAPHPSHSPLSGSHLTPNATKKNKSKSKTNSLLSSVSHAVTPWKVKSGKASPHDIIHLPVQPLPHHHTIHNHYVHSPVNSLSQIPNQEEEQLQHEHHHQHVPLAYEVRNSPAPQFKNSPIPHYANSPAPNFKNSPAPHYITSPAPQFKNSPAPHYKNSPATQYKNSPLPRYTSSPAPQFKSSPAPQFKSSPAPQFKSSPAPQFKSSPAPQFMNTPKPKFQNSPMPQYMATPNQQFRASPGLTKFNPAVGFGGSQRGTPMHPFGKVNGGLEYMTPRRSNLGHMKMGPVVMTESELGPSASEVAAAIARKPVIDEEENSTVGGWSLDESVEGLQSKLQRWRTDLPPVIDRSEQSSYQTSSTKTSRHSRRHTDGGSGSGNGSGSGGGLFSCFSKICGVECYVGCGGDPKGKKNISRRRRSPSVADDNTSLL